jgi:hypothetical protein
VVPEIYLFYVLRGWVIMALIILVTLLIITLLEKKHVCNVAIINVIIVKSL